MSRFVIAASRPWYRGLPAALAARTGHEFVLVTEPAGLEPARLAALAPARLFVPHWSWRIPAEVYDRWETVIFHMTDLPYGRGGSPLQNLVARGHRDTLLSALRCEAGLDTGPVYLKRPLSLAGSARQVFARAARIIEDMIAELVERSPRPAPQTGEPVVFQRRGPSDSDLAGIADLEKLYDHIRMLDAEGYPPAFLEVGGLRLEFTGADRGKDDLRARVRITRKDKRGG